MSYGSEDRILPKYGKGRGRFRHVRQYFLKPFLKGKILRSSERGVNSILTTILRF